MIGTFASCWQYPFKVSRFAGPHIHLLSPYLFFCSYMACTGLPNAQPDHAVRMTKFARECMAKMGQLLEELKGSLGEDTGGKRQEHPHQEIFALLVYSIISYLYFVNFLDLAMRVGLHSGPVTGKSGERGASV